MNSPKTDPKLAAPPKTDPKLAAPPKTDPRLKAPPKTDPRLKAPAEGEGEGEVAATFLITNFPDYLLIEAVGTFKIADMEAETARAAAVIRQPGMRWNIVTDFTHCRMGERGVNEVLGEYSQGNRPFVRKSAVLGLGGVKSFFFDLVVRLSGRRDLKPFADTEAALAWLRAPLPGEAPRA